MFSGVYWNQSVCPSICVSVSVCVQNTVRASGAIKLHLVTAVVRSMVMQQRDSRKALLCPRKGSQESSCDL